MKFGATFREKGEFNNPEPIHPVSSCYGNSESRPSPPPKSSAHNGRGWAQRETRHNGGGAEKRGVRQELEGGTMATCGRDGGANWGGGFWGASRQQDVEGAAGTRREAGRRGKGWGEGG